MNKNVLLALVFGCLLLGICVLLVFVYTATQMEPIRDEVAEEESVVDQNEIRATKISDTTIGLMFSYRIDPGGYSLSKMMMGNTQNSDFISGYTLTSQQDVVAMTRNPLQGEGPPTTRLRADEKRDTLSLREWTTKNAIETNIDFAFASPTDVVIAGEPAITFRADGLYAFLVYVVEKNGVVYIFETAFIGETDPIVSDFETLLASIAFIPRNVSEIPIAVESTSPETFRGTLEEVNVGCFVDGECYVVVSGQKVTLLRGWSSEVVGQVIGVGSIGDLESFIGEEISVYAQSVGDGTYSLYGDSRYYVKLSASGSLSLGVGETGTTLGTSITPNELIEDSRCPSDVTCIWAGTVRLAATLEGVFGVLPQEFTLNVPVTTQTEVITLVQVQPVLSTQLSVTESDYTFLFKITKR